MINAEHEIILDLKKLSERSCLSVRFLRDYLKPQHPAMIPHFRAGRKILFRYSEFLTWLENFRVEGAFQETLDGVLVDLRKSQDRHLGEGN